MTAIIYPDRRSLARATAARFLVEVTDAVAVRGIAHVVLTGGGVGIETLAEVAASPLTEAIDWTAVHVWWCDERFVGVGDPERNEGQAQAALLGTLLLPEENIHRMGTSGAFDTPEAAAGAYAVELARHGEPCPAFDIALLGLGADGHVASLFPGNAAVGLAGTCVAVRDSPKPPPERISLTLTALARARQIWVVAAGAEKADAVAGCLAGRGSLPGSRVRGTERTLWLIDAAASAAI